MGHSYSCSGSHSSSKDAWHRRGDSHPDAADLFDEMERQNKAAIDDWNRRLNKYRSDIDAQYGEFKRKADRILTDSALDRKTKAALEYDIHMKEFAQLEQPRDQAESIFG